MNNSGDVAEQMIRMSIEGVESAVKVTGTASKEIVLLLIAALKSGEKNNLKLKGAARLKSMLKSGKSLDIFSIKDSELAQFSKAAKEYGIVYCALRSGKNSPDGICDVMVKTEDAPRISRIIERYKIATVSRTGTESEFSTEKAAREAYTAPEPKAKDMAGTEKLLDELLGEAESKTKPAKSGKEQAGSPPFHKSAPKKFPSEPIFGNNEMPEKATSSKPSVKKELRDIKVARTNKAVLQNQPKHNKTKSKKMKGNR
jgi:hypothetical protein